LLEIEPSYELAVRNDSDQGSDMFGPWIRLSLDTTMLAVEAQTVNRPAAHDARIWRGRRTG